MNAYQYIIKGGCGYRISSLNTTFLLHVRTLPSWGQCETTRTYFMHETK